MKKSFIRKLLVCSMSLAMAMSVSAVTAMADDEGTPTTTTTWADLYAGLGVDDTASGYDAVTSATNYSSFHAKDIPTIVNRVKDAEGNITELDGVNLSGSVTELQAVKLASASYSDSCSYGTGEFVIVPDDTVDGYVWNTYKNNMYAVTISNGTTTAGAVPWVDYYGEDATSGFHYNKVEIALNNGTSVGSNKADVSRFADFYDENGDFKAGTYTITLYSEGFETLTAEVYVPVDTGATITAEDADTNAGKTAVTVENLADDFDVVCTVDGKAADYIPATADTSAVIDYSAAGIKAGTHTVTLTDGNGIYKTISTTFTTNNWKLPVKYDEASRSLAPAKGSDADDVTNFVSNITKTEVDGTAVQTVGRGAVTIVNADGSINSNAKTFVAGQTYTITLTSASSKAAYSFSYTCPVTLTDDAVALTADTVTYTGKALVPALTVTVGDAALTEGQDYTVTAENNINAGTATVTVTGQDDYAGSVTKEFTIAPAAQKLTVSGTTKTVKYTSVKKAATSTSAVAVTGAKGVKSYYKVSGSTKLTINKTSGKILVKKGTSKGTYSIKIKVIAAKTANYNASAYAYKTIKVTVK